LDLHSWLQRLAFVAGRYEDETTRFLLQTHRSRGRDGYVLDIGANVGLVAVPLALILGGRSPRVVAIEAVPDNIRALQENVALNELQSAVLVLGTALGEIRKTADIQVEGDLAAGAGSGTANLLPDGSTYECERQQITVETLDDLWDAGDVPHGCTVIKLDTDGYDLNVLRGARKFLMAERPVIFGEFSAHCLRWHGQSISDVLAFAEEVGYRVSARVGDTWSFTATFDPTTVAQDLLLVPKSSE